MKVLALETATLAGSVALVDEVCGLIGEVRVNVAVAHSERLMPSIMWLLDSSGISIRDIDAMGVSIGPGSFTGLRIGLSTAKGFAFSLNRPIVPVPTLEAFARTLPFSGHLLCPMLDARKGEVYAGLYRWEGGRCAVVAPERAVSPADLLEGISETVVFMGEGAVLYRNEITAAMNRRALFAPPSNMSPSASAVGELAIERLREGFSADPAGLTPRYIRKSEAEVRWKE